METRYRESRAGAKTDDQKLYTVITTHKTQLIEKVERYSDKPNNGGLSIDFAGNIYLTAVETKSIGVITPDRKYRH